MKTPSHIVQVSKSSIAFAILFVILLFMLYYIRDFLVLLFLSVVVSSALNPVVSRLNHKKIPRSLSVFLVYFSFIAVVILFFSLIIPPLLMETINLLGKLDVVDFSKITNGLFLNELIQSNGSFSWDLSNVSQSFGSMLSVITNTLSVVTSTFSSIFTVLTFFFITYYLLLERPHLHTYISWAFGGGEKGDERAIAFIQRLELQLGGWVRGELSLMFVIGLMSYIGFALLGVPYALPLAILAGLLEAVPNIGPIIAAVPAVALSFFLVSPAMGLFALILCIVIQQLENNLIVPKIMSTAAAVSPLVAIIVLIVGARLQGPVGMAMSIPFFIFGRTIVEEMYKDKLLKK